MRQNPLLPCPKCMGSLVETGLMYPGGQVVSRDLALRLRSSLDGNPLGVQYVCSHCGSETAISTRPPTTSRR